MHLDFPHDIFGIFLWMYLIDIAFSMHYFHGIGRGEGSLNK